MIKAIAALALALAPAGASAKPAKPGTAKAAEKIMEWKGANGGPGEAGARVVLDGADWKNLWRELGKDAPALDFGKFVAVAVFVGEKPTGGFTVEFLEPETKNGGLAIRYRIKEPDGFATQAFASPWKVRAFSRPKGKVSVEAAAP